MRKLTADSTIESSRCWHCARCFPSLKGRLHDANISYTMWYQMWYHHSQVQIKPHFLRSLRWAARRKRFWNTMARISLIAAASTNNILISEPIVLLKASLEDQPFNISQWRQEITSAPPRNATHSSVTVEDCTSFGIVVCEPSACCIYTDTLLHELPSGLSNDRHRSKLATLLMALW